MGSPSTTVRKTKRSWGDYARALGSVHKKASVQLETSVPLLQHLEELRSRVFFAFGAVIVTTAISFVFAEWLIEFFAVPLGGKEALVSIDVTENMSILLAGIVLGPERMARAARELGRLVRNVKAYFRSLNEELKSELEILDEIKKL